VAADHATSHIKELTAAGTYNSAVRQALEDSKLQDPAGQPVEVVRRIRDDIDGRVRRLLAELVPTGA
jgi:hypothetical protein